jgi:hypothetical protein
MQINKDEEIRILKELLSMERKNLKNAEKALLFYSNTKNWEVDFVTNYAIVVPEDDRDYFEHLPDSYEYGGKRARDYFKNKVIHLQIEG